MRGLSELDRVVDARLRAAQLGVHGQRQPHARAGERPARAVCVGECCFACCLIEEPLLPFDNSAARRELGGAPHLVAVEKGVVALETVGFVLED